METITMKMGDRLICDPGYIKSVECDGEPRFDGLRTERVLWDGGDGCFEVKHKDDGSFGSLGVDSGRIWLMVAEFGITVEIDSGFSGHKLLTSDRDKSLNADGFSVETLTEGVDYYDE